MQAIIEPSAEFLGYLVLQLLGMAQLMMSIASQPVGLIDKSQASTLSAGNQAPQG